MKVLRPVGAPSRGPRRGAIITLSIVFAAVAAAPMLTPLYRAGALAVVFGSMFVLYELALACSGRNDRAVSADLREANRLLVMAEQMAHVGHYRLDFSANEVYWSDDVYRTYGVPAATVPTLEWVENAYHPDDRERVRETIRRTLADGEPFTFNARVVRPDGSIRDVVAGGQVERTADGAIAGIFGVLQDVTDVQKLAADLRAEKECAEEANRAKSAFLARMSHEIRTPMNGIIGFTTLVLDGELSAEQRRYVAMLRDAGRSLLAIINDILDFSKLEAGRIELEHIPVDLNALVDGALSIVRSEALSKGIALQVEIATELPAWASGDPTRLRQTLLNLLTNALKFTERGSVHVTVRPELGSSADGVRFEVADTGLGIAPDRLHLLFGEFAQLEASTTRRYGGTGLGLAICKRLVEAMGGTIGVESSPGRGSTFWFTAHLPPIEPPQASQPQKRSNRTKPRRILVADDNRVNQIVVGSLLSRDGHTVVFAENGAQAVAAVRDTRFDLVLMDMRMPVMSGVEATRAIRALASPSCDVSIVAVTANAMADEVESCRAAGMNGHLAKPVDRELLRSAVARWTSDAVELPQRRAAIAQDHTMTVTDPDRAPKVAQFADSETLGIATLLDIFEGDVASVNEIFTAALTSIEFDLVRIEQSVATQNTDGIIEAAHRMKGTSGSVRSQRVMELSGMIQQNAKRDPQSIDADTVRELGTAVAEFRRDLEAYRRCITTPA